MLDFLSALEMHLKNCIRFWARYERNFDQTILFFDLARPWLWNTFGRSRYLECKSTRWWFQLFYFHPWPLLILLWEMIQLANVFQMAWNQQPDQFLSCRCPFHLHRCLFEAWSTNYCCPPSHHLCWIKLTDRHGDKTPCDPNHFKLNTGRVPPIQDWSAHVG